MSMQDLQTRQEARFVLWALRSAVCDARGDEEAANELAMGFALAGVSGTIDSFVTFARALLDMEWPLAVWHGPRCTCVSSEEVLILNSLAETAARLRQQDPCVAQWWRLVLPTDRIAAVDRAARIWLAELERSGVSFPEPGPLHSCLAPLEKLSGPARVH